MASFEKVILHIFSGHAAAYKIARSVFAVINTVPKFKVNVI